MLQEKEKEKEKNKSAFKTKRISQVSDMEPQPEIMKKGPVLS